MPILTDSYTRAEFTRNLTIHQVVERSVPISMLKKVVEPKAIKKVLDLAIMDLVLNLNLSNTINDVQVGMIVEDLLHEYPNESIEDFLFVFKRARHAEYGTIYRLDIAVIFGWMKKHLEEKYQILENNLMNEKENEYRNYRFEGKQQPNKDGSMPAIDVDKLLSEYLESIKRINMKSPVPLTQKQIAEEGGEHPKPKKYIPPSTNDIISRKIHHLWITENIDTFTGKLKIDGGLDEDTWTELNKERLKDMF